MNNKLTMNPALGAIALIVIAVLSYATLTINTDQSKDTAKADNNTVVAIQNVQSSSEKIIETAVTQKSSELPTKTPVPTSAPVQKNKIYTAKVAYESPGGDDSITVKLTLNGKTIEDVSIDSDATSRDSERYIQRFANSVNNKIIGKDIASINLSRVAGASLTTDAFNEALHKIQEQI